MSQHRPDTWATKRIFNPITQQPADLQQKPKRRPAATRGRSKRAAALAEMLDDLKDLDQLLQLAAEIKARRPAPKTTPNSPK